jgi:hypothetical protein
MLQSHTEQCLKFVEIHIKLMNYEAQSFTNFLVNTLNKFIISHYKWPADHFALHREHLFAHL